MRCFLFALFALSLSPAVALADNVALVLSNGDYESLPDVRGTADVHSAAAGFESREVTLLRGRDVKTARAFELVEEFERAIEGADRALVVLAGRMLSSNAETWFTPVNRGTDSFTETTRQSIPLKTIMTILSEADESAILVVATDGVGQGISRYLETGLGGIDAPDGVTVLVGSVDATARLLQERLTRPGRAFLDEARRLGFDVQNGRGPDQSFLPEEPRTTTRDTFRAESGLLYRLQDAQAWRAAEDIGSIDAYRGYLRDFPEGSFVRMARNRIAALRDTPEDRAERQEQSLDLSRSARREIQRDLSLLEYNTRGIDGIFGPGTRNAIQSWQRDNGETSTGFLTRAQIEKLGAAADRRAAELEVAAERRRIQQIQQDRAYWDETGSLRTEDGYRAYLRRFPDGEFADIAAERLALIRQSRGDDARVEDRRLWQSASENDTIAAYRNYLARSENGAFRAEAEDRIAALENRGRAQEARQRAQAEENALGLSAGTRRLVEARLNAMELQPGAVDGNFDRRTRRAIRRYQDARDLPRTGFLNEAVLIRLLADTVRQQFD